MRSAGPAGQSHRSCGEPRYREGAGHGLMLNDGAVVLRNLASDPPDPVQRNGSQRMIARAMRAFVSFPRSVPDAAAAWG